MSGSLERLTNTSVNRQKADSRIRLEALNA